MSNMSQFAEYAIVHLLLVAGVLALMWGPVVYLLHTVQLHTGGVV